MIRRSITGAAALLVLFHGYLFACQLWNGELAEPGLILRWLIAAALLCGLIVIRRRDHSMIWGRRALCIWLLAALLHGPAIARAGDSEFSLPALPAAITTVVQMAASIGLGLALIVLAFFARRQPDLDWCRAAGAHRDAFRLGDFDQRPLVAPRPPPFAPQPR
jgi:FtsH-binding integral membrane protein